MTNPTEKTMLEKVRRAVSNLVMAAGCSCCRADTKWYEAQSDLAKLLKISKYKDGSGYNFNKYSNDPV